MGKEWAERSEEDGQKEKVFIGFLLFSSLFFNKVSFFPPSEFLLLFLSGIICNPSLDINHPIS